MRALPIANDFVVGDRPAPAARASMARPDRDANSLEHCNNGAFLVSHGWPHFHMRLAHAVRRWRGYHYMRARRPVWMNKELTRRPNEIIRSGTLSCFCGSFSPCERKMNHRRKYF